MTFINNEQSRPLLYYLGYTIKVTAPGEGETYSLDPGPAIEWQPEAEVRVRTRTSNSSYTDAYIPRGDLYECDI